LSQRAQNRFEWPLQFFFEADGTRSTQDARRRWTKRGGGSHNRSTIPCVQYNASRATAWRRRRVAVARPVRIAFCTNLRFYLTFRERCEIGHVPELSTSNWSEDQNAVCVFCLKRSDARLEPVLLRVVNGSRLTRAISRRCRIARRRRRYILIMFL